MPKDLIIGVKTIGEQTQLSITGQRVLSSQWLQSKLIQSGKWELAKTRILHVESYAQSHLFSSDYLNQFNDVARVVFVGYSTESKPEKRFEEKQLKQQFDLSQHDEQRIDHCNIARSAAAAGLKALFDDNRDLTTDVLVDDFDGYDQYAAEGVYLEAYQFYLDEKKKQELKKTELSLLDKTAGEQSWNRGKLIADCQNFAKWLEQLPANYCTPSIFCDLAKQRLQGTKVQVEVHDEKWAKEHNMNLFLAVSHGSDQAPKVLELKYLNNPNKSNNEIDLAFVGKGVTFDSGGISLKASTDMKLMKADMGGAATVVATVLAIAQLNLPLNVIAVTMMVENMISGKATRPGDVVLACNGKTVEIDNTDAEGRLALSDGLFYLSKFKPEFMVDIATLTGGIGVALGSAAAGCFTTSHEAWKLMESSGYETNEFLWRMPLFRAAYKKQLKALSADLNNIGGSAGSAGVAASFLAEFIDFENVKHWIHLDIAKVVFPKSDECGTGRPTRAIIRFAEKIAHRE